jgi:hypothetical protein
MDARKRELGLVGVGAASMLVVLLVLQSFIGLGILNVKPSSSTTTSLTSVTTTLTTTLANTTLVSTVYFIAGTAATTLIRASLAGCSISRLTCTIFIFDGYPDENITISQNSDCLLVNFRIESASGFSCVSYPSPVLSYGNIAMVNATFNATSWAGECIASCTPKVGTPINGSIQVDVGSGNNWVSIQLAGAFTA